MGRERSHLAAVRDIFREHLQDAPGAPVTEYTDEQKKELAALKTKSQLLLDMFIERVINEEQWLEQGGKLKEAMDAIVKKARTETT